MWARRVVLSACILSELRRRSRSCKKNSALSPIKLSGWRRNFWQPNSQSVGKPLEMKPYKNQDPIRLVVADVDGTFVTQEKVLRRMREVKQCLGGFCLDEAIELSQGFNPGNGSGK